MIMSKQIIVESNLKHILKMSREDMINIIKTEAKIDKVLKKKASNSRENEIE